MKLDWISFDFMRLICSGRKAQNYKLKVQIKGKIYPIFYYSCFEYTFSEKPSFEWIDVCQLF